MRGRAPIGGVQSDGVVFSPLFSTTYRRLFCGQEAIGNTIVINLAQVRAPSGAVWGDRLPGPPEVVCHNDIGPYNIIFAPTNEIGLIDFDRSALGPRSWDLAYAIYRFAPFCGLGNLARFVQLPVLAERARLFCSAYGWPDPASLIELMELRLICEINWLRGKQQQDLAARQRLLAARHDFAYAADLAFLRRHRSALEDLTQ